jgi:ABC-2 type transport system ATP-binding protein
LRADEGSGTCLGHDVIAETRAIKREVGYMTQRFSFWDDLTVAENLDFTARIYAVSNRREAVNHTLERFGLADRRDQLAGTLSGGWKQRMALAACLIHRPQLLLLDEPTAGVDPKARRDFWDEIHRLAAEGLTFLIATHYMDEAERCTRLAYIFQGKLLAHGTADELIEQAHLITWELTGDGLAEVADQLRGRPGVTQVAVFGNTLHVSGEDAAALEAALGPFRERGFQAKQIQSSLEDVFIRMMSHPTEHAEQAEQAER